MFISPTVAAERLGVSKYVVLKLISQRELPSVRLTERTLRIDESDLEAYINKMKAK